jgi:hypothetical protein
MFISLAAVAGVAVLAGSWSGTNQVIAQHEAENQSITLEGWRGHANSQKLSGSFLVTADNAAHPTTLVTYTEDGGVITTGNRRGYLNSPGHGSWRRIGYRRYAETFILFRFDTAGVLLGTTKIRGILNFNTAMDESSGTFVTEARDVNGNITGTASGTIAGKRIKVELP